MLSHVSIVRNANNWKGKVSGGFSVRLQKINEHLMSGRKKMTCDLTSSFCKNCVRFTMVHISVWIETSQMTHMTLLGLYEVVFSKIKIVFFHWRYHFVFLNVLHTVALECLLQCLHCIPTVRLLKLFYVWLFTEQGIASISFLQWAMET